MVDISRSHARMIRPVMLAVLVCGLGACSSFDSATRNMADAITLYKPDVVQGNFVSKEQVEQLQPGMTRLQVRDVLGTPLMASVFHANRWDYGFTMKRRGVPLQQFKLSLFFKDDLLERHVGDEMPSEAEFVQRIGRDKKVKVPQLEATEAQLAKFPAPNEADGASAGSAAAPHAEPRPAGSYPPLEVPR